MKKKASIEDYTAFLRELQFRQMNGERVKITLLQRKYKLAKDFSLADIPPLDQPITDEFAEHVRDTIRANASAKRRSAGEANDYSTISSTEPELEFVSEEDIRIALLENRVQSLEKFLKRIGYEDFSREEEGFAPA